MLAAKGELDMGDRDCHEVVGAGLVHLIDGIAPFVTRVFSDALPPGLQWPELLRRKDLANGRRDREYSPRDLSLMLRSMTERLGELGYPFDRVLSRQAQNYASELREVRNKWAHNQEFTEQEAYRALDSAELLLREVGATAEADAVAELKRGVLPAMPMPTDGPSSTAAESATPAPASGPSDGLARGAARIEVSAVPVLSYPMAHCTIPVVDEVVVELVSEGGDRRGAALEVDVVCASGSLGGPKVLLVDLEAGKRTVLRNVDLLLDPAVMLTLDEQQPGEIRAVLRDAAGGVLGQHSVPVQILAANQWMAVPRQLGMEMLAAHVQPNAAAIGSLLLEASDRLRAATGRSALDGYQSESAERVDAIARAVFDAIAARDVRYAEPPASWGMAGQKVRTPAEVLEGRLGTCLDTTLTFAAALEQAGINSTLWLLEGHIFVGYWRVDASLPMVASTEVTDAANLVDLGQVQVVETTLTTGGSEASTFDNAVRAARARVAGDLSKVLGVTDIRQARECRIYPLPSRAVGADGSVQVTYYQAGAGPVIQPYVGNGSGPEADESGRRTVPPRVSRWKNALLDLSLRNRLINYLPASGVRLEIPGGALGRLEDQVSAGASISLLASDYVPGVEAARGIRFGRDLPEDARELLLADKRAAYIDVTSGQYKTRLRNLAYKAKTIQEETGSNNLYLAFGKLSWRFGDRDLRSPLILVPVTLSTTSRGESYRITIDEAGASTPNYCLLEKLRVSFGMEIPGLENPSEDASGIDLEAAFTAVRTAVLKAGLPFRVEESVDLAILQFAKFPLWKDLDQNWEELARNPLVGHLISTPLDRFADPVDEPTGLDLDDLGSRVPVPADSSQLEAVAEAVAGRTFVLEGPPGTGKSQTITNLLAHALSAGRRVLFVAEKRAALDVVKKRLESVGLGDLSLDLHDKSARPAAVRAQIRAALEIQISPDHDALRAHSEGAASARRRLATYAERLHDENAARHSLYSARVDELASDPTIPPLDVPRALVGAGTPEELDAVRVALRALPEHADLARPRRSHPWRFVDGPGRADVDAVAITAAARELDAALEAARGAGAPERLLAQAPTAEAIASWAALARVPRFDLAVLDRLNAPEWRAHVQVTRDQLDGLARTVHPWRASVLPQAMNLDLPAIHAAALSADASGFFGRKKRRRAVLAQLQGALAADPRTFDLSRLSALTKDLAACHAMVSSARAAVGQIPISTAPPGWNPAVPEEAARVRDSLDLLLRLAADLASDGTQERATLREFYASTPAGAYAPELERVAHAWRALMGSVAVDHTELTRWLGGEGFLSAWWAHRAGRHLESPAEVERWLALVRVLEPLRAAGMEAARGAILDGDVVPDDAVLAFNRGLALASLDERLESTALGDFDLTAHNRTVARFTHASRGLREALPAVIPAEVMRLRRFNPSAPTGQMGALRRQLERQRGGMSVRGLMQHYGELITQIMPCTLMSPESVARFFPARAGLFDIVVFDEASQIRVADAVGAMGRATSVIVVGDSKQMPPTTFAEVSLDIDESDDVTAETVVDEESILTECVNAQVPRKWLSWHYRSQDESLIAFSNRYYYEDRLSSFPAPLPSDTRRHPDGFGISLVRVNGTFQRTGRGQSLRTNQVEAEAIVDDVRRRFWASPDAYPSLGIITFNVPQRNLIENLLRDSDDERITQALDEPDGLFVKNLENVQGDERDCILFSVAFSANEKGVVPLNFGPLSRPGGERRLNVAITRARRQVVLYASFAPEELRAEETVNDGVKHLKAYLDLAARGVEAIPESTRRARTIDRHRDEVAAELRAAGYAVRTDVGLSDFRVDLSVAAADDPDTPLVAILLDGPAWRSRRTVADRDGLPVDVLKRMMNWPAVERVWLPEWLHHREETTQRLIEVVEAVKEGREPASARADLTSPPEPHLAASVPPPVPPPPTGAVGSAAADPPAVVAPLRAAPGHRETALLAPLTPADVADYIAWEPERLGDVSWLDALPNRRAAERVVRAVRAAVEEEGPVQPDRLAKLVAASFGLSRVAEARKTAIKRVVPEEYRQSDREGFYWPTHLDVATWTTVRRPADGEARNLDEVSLIEIGNAMRVVALESGGATSEELERGALHLLGGRRITEAIGKRLTLAFKVAIDRGRIVHSYDGIYVAGMPAER